jgi:hypothetical protein
MKSLRFLPLSLALTAGCAAQTPGRLADVAIIDRDSGATLSPYYYRGEYWVAGRPGARYAIEVRNRIGERLLAVTSVDGVNVISGATAAWDQAGYVFSPREEYRISGWRKSDAEVAAFTFTESPNSYAERTGRPANVGVIGIALYREIGRLAAPVSPAPISPTEAAADAAAGEQGFAAEATARLKSQASMLARAAPAAAAPAASAGPSTIPAPAARLGTGHGEREYSYVTRTEFVRMQPQPNEVIRIRYDSMDNLLAMGIVKRARPAPSGVDPFPASPDEQYVPDPPG